MLGFLIVVVILIVIILVAKNFAAQENGLNIEKTEDLTDDLREKKFII